MSPTITLDSLTPTNPEQVIASTIDWHLAGIAAEPGNEALRHRFANYLDTLKHTFRIDQAVTVRDNLGMDPAELATLFRPAERDLAKEGLSGDFTFATAVQCVTCARTHVLTLRPGHVRLVHLRLVSEKWHGAQVTLSGVMGTINLSTGAEFVHPVNVLFQPGQPIHVSVNCYNNALGPGRIKIELTFESPDRRPSEVAEPTQYVTVTGVV